MADCSREAVEAFAGLIEIRGIGLVRQEARASSRGAASHRPVDDFARAHASIAEDLRDDLCGVALPRLRASAGAADLLESSGVRRVRASRRVAFMVRA